MRVLIVEDGRSSFILPAVRSLGRAGWTVGLATPDGVSRATASRWVRRRHRVPPAEAGLDAFGRAVGDAITSGGYDVVFGGDDVEVLALSACRDQLAAVVPYAAHASVVRSIDKLELTMAAANSGIDVPSTTPASPAALAATALPVVVKARLHWTPGATGEPRHPVAVCATRDEATSRVAEIEAEGGEAILQAPVDGTLMALTLLVDRDGVVRARSQQVADVVSPHWRTSARARTVVVDEDLASRAMALLGELGWFGLANLQFLRPPGGRPHLIDLNGRFYGSLALTSAAGLDLPAWWAALAVEPSETGVVRCPAAAAPVTARPGVRYQALENDLRRAVSERRGGAIRDVVGCLTFASGAAHSTWDVRDPLPSLARAWSIARQQVHTAR